MRWSVLRAIPNTMPVGTRVMVPLPSVGDPGDFVVGLVVDFSWPMVTVGLHLHFWDAPDEIDELELHVSQVRRL